MKIFIHKRKEYPAQNFIDAVCYLRSLIPPPKIYLIGTGTGYDFELAQSCQTDGIVLAPPLVDKVITRKH